MPLPNERPHVAASARVLVIDDDPDIHGLVDVRLHQATEPIEVLHALDGETGLQLAGEHRPDAILLDLDLQGRSGIELCRALQADPRTRGTPVLFLTGTFDVATKVRAFEAGASDYVTKPFDAVELRARVQAALRATRYRAHLERVARQGEKLLQLSGALETSWIERLHTLLREDATTLAVGRTSYWRLAERGEAIVCEALFAAASGRFESGHVLRATDLPRYFQALRTMMPIVADDARTHPDTSELTERYLDPVGIGAMLDVPVFVRGELMGVVCHEHLGGRRAWAVDERQFATSVGHLVSLAIASEDRRHAQDALRASETRFRAIASVSPVPMVVTSLGGQALWANAAVSRMIAVPETTAPAKLPDLYVNPADRQAMIAEMRVAGTVDRREVRLRRANGEEFWGMVSGQALVFDEEPAVLIGFTDLSEQKRMEEILRHTALHDALTGLPNRVLLFDFLQRELARADRDDTYRFALLYFDLDGFKPVNDGFGHDVGDRLLVSVARRVTAILRPMDVAARVGGDEFAVALAGVRDLGEVEQVAARLEAAIVAPHRFDERELRVGVSIGVVLSDKRFRDPSALVRAGDEAMYARKRLRRQPG